jgi:hypothetical protein
MEFDRMSSCAYVSSDNTYAKTADAKSAFDATMMKWMVATHVNTRKWGASSPFHLPPILCLSKINATSMLDPP